MLCKHFQMSHSNEEASAKGRGSFPVPQKSELEQIQLAMSPLACGSMQNHLQKFLLHWVLSRPMQCVQGSQNTLSREKRKAYCLEWLRTLLVAIQGSYHSLNLPFPPAKSQLHRTPHIEL